MPRLSKTIDGFWKDKVCDIENRLTNVETNQTNGSQLIRQKPTFQGAGMKITDDLQSGIEYGGKRYTTLLLNSFTREAYLNNPKTCCPLLGPNEYINIPTAPILPQISSSSALDVGNQVLITGYDDSFNAVQDIVVLNGQTPAAGIGGQPFFRIIKGIVFFNASAVSPDPGNASDGDLYMTDTTYAGGFSGGVPNTLTSCYALGYAGIGFLQNGLEVSVPGESFISSSIVASLSTIGKSLDVAIKFYTRDQNFTWLELAEFGANGSSNSFFLEAFAFPGLSLAPYVDIQIVINRLSGGQNDNEVELSVFTNSVIVEDI